MNWWRRLLEGKRMEEQLDKELQFHMQQHIEGLIARGVEPVEARRLARLELGGPEQVKEQCRDERGTRWLADLAQDVVYAFRMLRRSPGFTAVAVLTLALGIGANTAIFSAVNPILFEPLPYPRPERIGMIWDVFQGARSDVTFHTYREVAERSQGFEALGIFEPWQPTLVGAAEPERLDGQSVSYGYFAALGVAPAIGRDFAEADDAFRGPKTAILSYGLWQRRFGGEAGIVGSRITLDGDSYTVIGVMPRQFENVLGPTAEIWSPEQYDPGHITDTNTAEWGHHLRMVGRVRAGVSLAEEKAEIDAIARTPVPEFPRPHWASIPSGFIVDSLQGDVTRDVKAALLAVLGAVGLVLLIACVNVTNLLLARGALRRAEFSMRAALGARRMRLVRQLLTESLLLTLAGGAAGVAVAEMGVKALVAMSPAELPRLGVIGIDRNVLLFALCVTVVVGLAVGLVPALDASKGDVQAGLKEGSRQSTRGHQLTRRALVMAEVALALALLVSAGLLLRSASRLFAVHPGFDAANLLTMQVQTSGHKFDDPKATRQFFREALEQVRGLPGVESAALTSLLPVTDDTQYGLYGTEFEKDQRSYDTFRYVVTPGYFETMRIPILRGRALEKSDVAESPFAAVISESLANEEFGKQDPIGQRVHVGGFPNWPWYTIVGVAGDVRQESLATGNSKAAYITPEQSWFADSAMSLVVRVPGDGVSLVPAIQKAVWSVDKDQPIVRIATAGALLKSSAAQRSFVLVLFEAFSLVALALAAVGIYGVLSGNVAERTREIGVRLALGAPRANILLLIFRQGLMLTARGLVIGLAGAMAASQALGSLLFGVSSLDFMTYFVVTIVLIGASGIACWIPARRAMQVDPIVSLRYE